MSTNTGIPYTYPSATRGVSDSFKDHVARGSVNPGTDYTSPWGKAVYAVQDGHIAGTVNSFAGSGGRMIYLDLDDGSGLDYLHLSQINVLPGERVLRGDLIGYSGASGYGSEWYYGAHLHVSIRPSHTHHTENFGNYDFDAFIKAQWSNMNWTGDGSTPIDNTPKEVDDVTLFKATSTSGLAIANWHYLQAPDGTFRALGVAGGSSNSPADDYIAGHPGVVAVSNAGSDLSNKFAAYGLWEYTGDAANGPWGLTGKLLGRNGSGAVKGGSLAGAIYPRATV